MERAGGAEGSRTPDPHNAIVVLYQLSYDPSQRREIRVNGMNVKKKFRNPRSFLNPAQGFFVPRQ